MSSTRVRAVLLTPDGSVLTIRRVKPGRPVYWTLPGGHVEPGDTGLRAALERELAEELGGDAVVDRLVFVDSTPGDTQYFYLGRITTWTGPAADSPEAADPGNGEYHPEPVSDLATVDLLPVSIARLLREHAASPLGLAGLPAVTRSAAARPR